jgi:hypothetical protein
MTLPGFAAQYALGTNYHIPKTNTNTLMEFETKHDSVKVISAQSIWTGLTNKQLCELFRQQNCNQFFNTCNSFPAMRL